MDKITVIIPVYNVEKYLKVAIDATINQTYKNLEIILVDDGSTDSSGKICDEYSKIDNRIKVIHQKNKGLSGARNTGLDNATGKYIMFSDSDDTFELDACEKLYNFIEETNADYVVGNYTNMDEDGTKWDKPVFDLDKYFKSRLSIQDYTNSFYTMNSGVWNKIFRKSFLDDIEVRFIEKLPAEDAIFTTYCFMKSKCVYYTPDIVYDYRLRDSDSISSSCSKTYFMGINKAYRIIYNNFKENDCLDYYRFFYAKSMNYILYKFIDSDELTKEERIDILDNMKWFYVLSNDLKIPTILKSVQYIIESITKKDYSQTLKYCEILNQVRKMLPKEIKEKMSKPSANTYKQIESTDINIEILEKKEKLLEKMKDSKIRILEIEESLRRLINEKKSIARFGDEEFNLIMRTVKYQELDPKLCDRLEEILKAKQEHCIIAIPEVINEFNNLTEESEAFWIKNMDKTRETWIKYLNTDMEYCTSNLTKPYVRHKDRSNSGKYFDILKEVWKDRDVLICEGEQTQIGVGNDLLDNAKSIKRIIFPSEDVFSKYDEIIERLSQESKDTLIIIALGTIAPVLAYDLSNEGYQALDLGNFDIEYELYIKNIDKKEEINKKYMKEIIDGSVVKDKQNEHYLNQIEDVIN